MDIDATQVIDLDYEDNEGNISVHKKKVGTIKTRKHKKLAETEFPVVEGVNTIGRDERSDIQIKVQGLSKKHACIEVEGDSYLIFDLQSRNKTRKGKVLLKPYTRYELKDGDELTFGDVTAIFSVTATEDADETDSITDAGSETDSESMIPLEEENIPTEETSKNVELTNNNVDDLYAAETESESDGNESSTPAEKKAVTVVSQTPGFGLSQKASRTSLLNIPDSPPSDGKPELQIPSSYGACDGNDEVIGELEQYAATVPYETSQDLSLNEKSGDTEVDPGLKCMDSGQFADTLPYESKNEKDEDDEESSGTYQFNDYDYEDEHDKIDDVDGNDDNLPNLDPVCSDSVLPVAEEVKPSQGISFKSKSKKYITSTQLLDSFESFGTPPVSSINCMSADESEQSLNTAAKKTITSDSEEDCLATPSKDVFKVPSAPTSVFASITTLPGGCHTKETTQEQYYDAVDASTHMSRDDNVSAEQENFKSDSSFTDNMKCPLSAGHFDGLDDVATQVYAVAEVEDMDEDDTDEGEVNNAGHLLNEPTQFYADENLSTQAYCYEAATQSYGTENNLLINQNNDPSLVDHTEDDDESTQPYALELPSKPNVCSEKIGNSEGAKILQKDKDECHFDKVIEDADSNAVNKCCKENLDEVKDNQHIVHVAVTKSYEENKVAHNDRVSQRKRSKEPDEEVVSESLKTEHKPKKISRRSKKTLPSSNNDESHHGGRATRSKRSRKQFSESSILNKSTLEDEDVNGNVRNISDADGINQNLADVNSKGKTSKQTSNSELVNVILNEGDKSTVNKRGRKVSTKDAVIKSSAKKTRGRRKCEEDEDKNINDNVKNITHGRRKLTITIDDKQLNNQETEIVDIVNEKNISQCSKMPSEEDRSSDGKVQLPKSRRRGKHSKINDIEFKQVDNSINDPENKNLKSKGIIENDSSDSFDVHSGTNRKRHADTTAASDTRTENPDEIRKTNVGRARKKVKSSVDSPQRLSGTLKPRIAFTGMSDKTVEKMVTELGGKIEESISKATHLVTDKVRRTVKFLCAVGKGIPIVNSDWIKSSKVLNMFSACKNHMLVDECAETQYKFKLNRSIQYAAEMPLLTNYRIFVTKNVKPDPKNMKEMIECCGGKFLSKLPQSPSDDILVISCPEDEREYNNCNQRGFCVCSNELLLTGILRQALEIDQFLLSSEIQPDLGNSKGRRETNTRSTTQRKRR